MRDKTARILLYIVVIFTQVYQLYGANSTINATVTETRIHLEWSAGDLNSSYLVKYALSSTPDQTTAEDVTLPADNSTNIVHEITGLGPGHEYLVQLEKDGIGVFADNITTKPLPVETFSASFLSSNFVMFSWSPSNVSVQDSYQILVIGKTNVMKTVQDPATSFKFDGLAPSTSYQASMVTVSHGELSNSSQLLSFNTAPVSPVGVIVVAIDTQTLNVTWAVAPDSVQDGYIVGYTYNVSDGNVENEMSGNVTCPTASALYCEISRQQDLPGQVYEIHVYSKLGAAVSPSTGVIHSTVPLPVSSLTEHLSNATSLHLKWTIPENTEFYFRHFAIHMTSQYGDSSYEVGVTERELPLTGLMKGSMYNVTIVTSTGYELSQPVTATFYTYPAPVDSLSLDSGTDVTNTSFTVTWTISANATFDNFVLDIDPAPPGWSGSQMLNTDVISFPFTGLTPGDSYVVSIATKLADKQSGAVTQTIHTVPNQPVDPEIFMVTGTEISVAWKAPGGVIEAYVLTLTGPSDPKIVSETGTSYIFVNLDPGTSYTVKLEAQSGSMVSGAVSWSVTTNPAAVENLRVTLVDSHNVDIRWDVPSNNSFDSYRITVEQLNRTVVLNKNLPELTYRINDLEPGTFYTVGVVTISGGVASDRVAVNVITSPLPVIDLRAQAFSTGLQVTWRAQNGSSLTGFTVSYQQDLISGVVSTVPPVPYEEGVVEYSTYIPDLYPGGRYKVMVQAWQNVSGETGGSSLQEVSAATKPMPVENAHYEVLDATTVVLDWDAPTDSRVEHYLVKHRPILRNPSASWVVNQTYNSSLTLAERFPGEKYEIEIYADSDNVRSDAENLTFVIAPLPPSPVNVLADNTTGSSVTLQWVYDTSITHVESWVIRYQDNTGAPKEQVVARPGTGQTVTVVISGLVSGFKYDMRVLSVVDGTYSEEVTVQAVTKPINNITLSFDQRPTNTSFVISYDFQAAEHFDSIVFRLLDSDMTVTRTKTDSPQEVEFSPLTAGALFTVKVYTVSGGVESETKFIQAQTEPNAASVVITASSRELELTIEKPSGGVDSYKVTCYSPSNLIVKDLTITDVQPSTSVSANMLTPHTRYRCSVMTVFGMYESATTVFVTTLQAAPSAVRDLVAVENEPNQVTLTWKNPEQENGVISLYMLQYTGTLNADTDSGRVNVTYPQAHHVFKGLKAGYQYTFNVQALTVEAGDVKAVTVNMKTYKPPLKPGVDATAAMPKLVDASVAPSDPYTVTVNFSNVFSDVYGRVIEYTVIVSEEEVSADVATNHILPGWKVARQDRTIKAYQVIQNCSTFFDVDSTCNGQFGVRERRAVEQADYKLFVIGSETGCENRYYCNGPLKPDTTYYITLRAYTTMDHTDTPVSEPLKTAALPVQEEKGSNVGGIVGGVIGVLVGVGVMMAIVIVVRRRRQTKSNMYRHQPGEQLTNRSSLSHRKSNCAINLADFKQHIQYMRADSDFKYAEQFEDLKEIGRGQACTAAEQPCNRGKNRFTNILPYDHSRVKLLPIDDEDGSDYINANYIPGYSSKREYIVCQGPLPATREDFWRMLWEQNTRNIVMLTKCIEKGREKCDQYWPNGSDAVFYGDLQVAALNETLFPDWTITEFRVSLGDQSRQIRHFHFTSWPDFGVPKKEQVLVRFVRMVREKLFKDAGPIIVHCSAGVGRSGTFVVLDRLLQHIKSHDSVDIFAAVSELRKQRVWMVQTEQQYICIHNCLLCVLEGREDEHIYDNVGHSNIAFEDDEGVDLN